MIGGKFKSLTVISLDEKKNEKLKKERKMGLRSNAPIYYICQCDCGNMISIQKSKLKNRKIFGCEKCSNINFNNYIGKQINSWVVLDYKDKSFICQCLCGEIKKVNPYNIINNQSKDCGCGRKKSLSDVKKKDIIGCKYGKLTVIEEYGKTNYGKLLYKCRCDCGNECIVNTTCLYNGNTTSCGCLNSSKGVFEIKSILDNYNIKYETEKIMKNMKHISYLRFDFFIEDFNIAIEYDGEQHFKPVKWFGGLEGYEKTITRDKVKNKYCEDNNIILIRIPYSEKDIKNIIVEKIIKKYYAERLNEESTYKK